MCRVIRKRERKKAEFFKSKRMKIIYKLLKCICAASTFNKKKSKNKKIAESVERLPGSRRRMESLFNTFRIKLILKRALFHQRNHNDDRVIRTKNRWARRFFRRRASTSDERYIVRSRAVIAKLPTYSRQLGSWVLLVPSGYQKR